MWRPATRATTTGTNDVPLANKRRFGLPEEAPPPPGGPPSNYPRPPPADMEFFNGRVERDAARAPPPPPTSSRWDEAPRVKEERRDDRSYDRRDERGYERRDDRGGYDRGGDRERYDRERERDSHRQQDRAGRYDEDRKDVPPADDAPRKRKSRWGAETAKVDLPGLPSQITGNVSQVELDNYAIHVRLEEIGRKLRANDVVPPPGQRSPSPEPEYDAYGRRVNTLELRYKKRLEDERLQLIDRAMKADPTFKPPADVRGAGGRMGGRPTDKVYIPVKEFPEINFFGLLVGPRGNSLKKMERETGAKISIRGKGSVKEGKGRQGDFPNDEDDELHCLVSSDDEYKVKKCVALINRVIETAASTPEGQNDHKRNQLRELAMLNGTLRDDENQLCQNCGEKGHRRFDCPQQRSYSANVICRLCGGAGHMARDCRGRGEGAAPPPADAPNQAAFDSEYSALMAELGEHAAANATPGGAPKVEQNTIPPWRLPENWQSQHQGGGGGGGGARGGYAGGGGGGQAPHRGYNQQHANQGYGYGQYQPQQDMGGYGGGQYQQQQGQGYGQGQGQGGQGDQYASYYAGLGQAA